MEKEIPVAPLPPSPVAAVTTPALLKKILKAKGTLGISSKEDLVGDQSLAEDEKAPTQSKDTGSDLSSLDIEKISTYLEDSNNSLSSLNIIFKNINETLLNFSSEKNNSKYQEEETSAEKKQPLAMTTKDKEEKEGPSFFSLLKNLFMNPAVLAAVAGIVYTLLPEDLKKRIKSILKGFTEGVDDSTGGLKSASTSLKVLGVGIATYFGVKFIKSIADAITTTIKLIKSVGRMSRAGKLAVAAAVGYGTLKVGQALVKNEDEKESEEEDETESEEKEESEEKVEVIKKTDEKTVEKEVTEGKAPEAELEEKPGVSASKTPSAGGGTPRPEAAAMPKGMEGTQGTAAPSSSTAAPGASTTETATKPTVGSVDLPGKTSSKASGQQESSGAGISLSKKGPGFKAGVNAMNAAMDKEGITNPVARAQILAQTAHESGGFKYTEELASGKAYEGRKDLGNVQPGDGPRYKGRGFLQITGRSNYASISKDLGTDFVSEPEKLGDPKFAAESALWFFKQPYNAKRIKDWNDTRAVTKVVNGGYNGLEEREKYFTAFMSEGAGESTETAATSESKPGVSGTDMAKTAKPKEAATSAEKVVTSGGGEEVGFNFSQFRTPKEKARLEAERRNKGASISDMSMQNEAAASTAAAAPIITNQTTNSTQNIGKQDAKEADVIPSPIANRGSLANNTKHLSYC
jgi:predicted chitinase